MKIWRTNLTRATLKTSDQDPHILHSWHLISQVPLTLGRHWKHVLGTRSGLAYTATDFILLAVVSISSLKKAVISYFPLS